MRLERLGDKTVHFVNEQAFGDAQLYVNDLVGVLIRPAGWVRHVRALGRITRARGRLLRWLRIRRRQTQKQRKERLTPKLAWRASISGQASWPGLITAR